MTHAVLRNLLDQVQQMRGLFPDEDGAIGRAVDDAKEALDFVPRLAVVIEGGVLSSIITDDPGLVGTDVLLIDYDTDGVDAKHIFVVGNSIATGGMHEIELASIDLEQTWQNARAS